MGVESQSSNTNSHKTYSGRVSARLDRILRDWSSDGRQISRPLKATFLVFLLLAVCALTVQNSINAYRDLEAPLLNATVSAQELLRHQKVIGSSGLEQTLLGISTNSNLVEAIEFGLSDRIRDVASDLLEELETFHDVSQFTIYDATITHEFHVHDPGLFERAGQTYLVKLASAVGRTTRGFELNDAGMAAIAAVRPIKVRDETVGYAKLSMDLRRPLSLISSSLDADVLEVYSASHLAEHPQLDSQPGRWVQFGNYHVRNSGIGSLPPNFEDLLENSFTSSSVYSNAFIFGGRLKALFSSPVVMTDGTRAGTLVLVHDITDKFWAFVKSTGWSILIGMLLAALSWVVFNRLIQALQRSIHQTREQLEQEVIANTIKVQNSHNRLIEAQKIAAIGSWEREIQSGKVHWSDELYRILGLPVHMDASVARQQFYGMLSEQERDAFCSALTEASANCSDFDVEYQVVRKDGTVRHLHTRGYVVPDSNGNAERVLGATHDITDWHIAQEQNHRLASILEASLNEVYIFDAKTLRFEHANKCARENLGYSMDELQNLEAWSAAKDYTAEQLHKLLEPLVSGDMSVLNLDGVLQRKNGSEYPVEVRLQLHRERNKNLIVAITNDISDRIAREQEILAAREEAEHIAYYDALTQLANRACCQREAEVLFAESNQNKPSFIIHLDLDNFKRINDTLGHTAGDACLEEVGERLKMCCTGLGKAYRWGGDEFVIISSGPDANAEELCERLNIVMRAPMEFEGKQIWPSVSMGVSSCPEDGEDFGTLLVHADLALYRSKDDGKDRWCFFTSDMKIDSDEEARLDEELRQAVRRDEFFLVFQPQVNIRTHRITGVEALVRWQHPTRGTLGPGAFLPTVEKSNLASTLGEIVINKALQAARSWQDDNIDFGRIAVNLSPSHLTSGTLLHDFDVAMKRHGVGPEKITAEVLESVFLDNGRSDNAQVLEELHRIGVHIELDDFGTGYASLSHVADLPINGLKIDRSFTAKILDDERKEIVVNQLIHLARSLNIGLICEGVETDAQLGRLRMMGDFSVQGYLIARPMPYDAITDWLSETTEDLVSII